MGYVSLRRVTKIFQGPGRGVPAVRDAWLDIPAGAFVAVTGPSGSGKSTLLHLIGGVDTATEGELTVAGHELHRMSDAQLARYRLTEVGFVFQAFHLIPSLTVFNNVALPALLAGRRPADVRERVRSLLTGMGVDDLRDRLPHELSGGEQQRAAVARALVNEPGLILADEPTGNLDSESGERVLRLLASVHDEGRTLILITHDAGVAGLAEHLLQMRDGRVMARTARATGAQPAPNLPLP